MAHVQKLPDDALDAIAKQVGRLYPSLDNNVKQHQPLAELTETFPVWFLSIDPIKTGNNNLLELAQDTLRWHSQISIDGKPEGVVRTMASSGDTADWTVRQILKGDFAKTVDDAIRWVDAEVATDSLVRILEIPAFLLRALWLIDEQESSVVIARLPEYLQSLSPWYSTPLKISWRYYDGNPMRLVSVMNRPNLRVKVNGARLSEIHLMFVN